MIYLSLSVLRTNLEATAELPTGNKRNRGYWPGTAIKTPVDYQSIVIM